MLARGRMPQHVREKISKTHKEKKAAGYNPRKGENEIKILDEIEKKIGFKIERQVYLKELGYFIDGYCKDNNTVYEIYEVKHRRNKNMAYDLKRKKLIQEALGCKFQVIWDYGTKSYLVPEEKRDDNNSIDEPETPAL